MSLFRTLLAGFLTLIWGSEAQSYRKAGLLVLGLSLLPLVLVWGAGSPGLSAEESGAMETVRAAQESLCQYRQGRGLYPEDETDPHRLGLIGLEWSPVTTTLGDRKAKEAACQPAWAAVFLRWFDRLGLEAGDPVVVACSGSFPGLVVSVLTAAERRGLDVLLLPSLGASTWGANIPEFTLLDQLRYLREKGYMKTAPAACSLGGGQGEMGGGLSPEGRNLLLESVTRNGVPLLEADDLKGMIDLKMARILDHRARLVVQIGGSMANLGPGPEASSIPTALLLPGDRADAGSGLIARTLEEGIPVGHLLHIEGIARRERVPFRAEPSMGPPHQPPPQLVLPAILIWLGGLFLHKRWRMAP